jgi:hypothetical protein
LDDRTFPIAECFHRGSMPRDSGTKTITCFNANAKDQDGASYDCKACRKSGRDNIHATKSIAKYSLTHHTIWSSAERGKLEVGRPTYPLICIPNNPQIKIIYIYAGSHLLLCLNALSRYHAISRSSLGGRVAQTGGGPSKWRPMKCFPSLQPILCRRCGLTRGSISFCP